MVAGMPGVTISYRRQLLVPLEGPLALALILTLGSLELCLKAYTLVFMKGHSTECTLKHSVEIKIVPPP